MNPKKDLNLEDILADKSAEDDLLEVPLTDRIFHIFFIITLITALVVVVQFFNLSVFKHKIFSQSAFANITDKDIEPAPRGLIKDKFGNDLVKNQASFSVFLSVRDFPEDTDKRSMVFDQISSVLNINRDKTIEKIKNHDWRLGKLLLKKGISHEKLVTLSAEELPGITVEPGFSRIPVHPKAFSHVLGYSGLVSKEDLEDNPDLIFQDEIGKAGLEYQYDKKLRGENGEEIAYMNAKMEVKDKQVINEPKIGETIKTYIDSEFQKYFYDRLKKQVESLNANGGVGLAVNPQNGEVLALTNVPSFDLNNLSDSLQGTNQPFFNRAVSGLYSPGSTIKPLVATAALEEGIVTPYKQFLSTGELVVPNPYDEDNPSVFKDWKEHGWVNLHSALARSSNVYFYIVGGGYKEQEGLGITRLNKWWEKFNLDKKTQIDLPDEESGFLPNPQWKEKTQDNFWRVGDTYNVSIGQGQLLITPLELISYISAIANGGEINKFRISQTQEKEVIKDISLNIKSALKDVRKGMKDVVDKEYGTAHYLDYLPFEVAAKTGTSQVGNHETNALFVGYAPFDNPEIAILVLIENAEEGGLNSVPVASDVLNWYYQNRIKEGENL